MIRLDDEEIATAITTAHKGNIRGSDFIDEAKPAVIAQLKKVVGWGDEPCPHLPFFNKRTCTKCWQSLLDEAK